MKADIGSHLNMVARLQQLLPGGQVCTDPPKLAAAAGLDFITSPRRAPECILQPANAGELQAIIDLANETDMNLTVTSSTGAHRNGGSANPGKNVMIDLSHWQTIDLIDRRNRVCRIEPGVTYGQLMAALTDQGMTVPMPLAPRNGKSVLASVMDREPSTWPNKQWDASDPVGSTEFFFGTGERFRSGAGGGPGTIEQQRLSGGAQKFSSGPSQADFHRVLQGSQGTMGILTWITMRTEVNPTLQKTLLACNDRLENLIPFVYAVQRGLLGEHTFILDRMAAAMLLTYDNLNAFDKVYSELPAFICIQNSAGFERLPKERLSYHLKDIHQLARQFNVRLDEGIGSLSAGELYIRATQPCGEIDWRDTLRGKSYSIFFLSTLDHMPRYREIILNTAHEIGIPESDIGTYIQPVVQNHACHIEFIHPFDPNSEAEVNRLKQFERQAVNRLMSEGAFFSRPYGSAGEMVWAQNPANYQLVKTIKGIFDPKRILQRGKWGL